MSKRSRRDAHIQALVEWPESKEPVNPALWPGDKQRPLTSAAINGAGAWERQPANFYNNVEEKRGFAESATAVLNQGKQAKRDVRGTQADWKKVKNAGAKTGWSQKREIRPVGRVQLWNT